MFYVSKRVREWSKEKRLGWDYSKMNCGIHCKDYFQILQMKINLLVFISASHPNLQYVADFAPELGLIIMETKYLEQLGFQVPELARNVALQVFCQIMSLNFVWNKYACTWMWCFLYNHVNYMNKFLGDHNNIPIFSSLCQWPLQAVSWVPLISSFLKLEVSNNPLILKSSFSNKPPSLKLPLS